MTKYDPRAQGRSSGIVVPLQSLRSEKSPAVGEYPDLIGLGKLAKAWGFDLIQLLPVNDSGYQSSPYSALSAFALHPLYIAIADLPELSQAGGEKFLAAAAELGAKYAGDARFRYQAYLKEKLKLLEKIWNSQAEAALGGSPKAPESAERSAFEFWMVENSWVKPYAIFVELKRLNAGKAWWEWTELRDPTAADILRLWNDTVLRSGCRFQAWLQWRAEGQFRAASAALAAQGISLMGDIPILISEDSAEVWARRSVFKLGLAAGAPPDMYAEFGQNWGFPIYDWEAARPDQYSFWKERLASAQKFYNAYRIDHVLGFFRIWALSARDNTGYLGRFVPDSYIKAQELAGLGFSPERLRWLSRPHIPTARLEVACGGDSTEAMEAALVALDRIGNEELYLFKALIKGEKDIEALATVGLPGYGAKGFSARAKDFLLKAWRDRVLHEFEEGTYVPTWKHWEATAWASLSEAEKKGLEDLFARKKAEGEKTWEKHGKELLSVLAASSTMLPCAEDLGAVPDCVPRVLESLGIYGLRVLRWTKAWNAPGQPYVPVAAYPRLTIACPSVHDSSSLRGWYEGEADKAELWALASASLGRDLGPVPESLDPKATAVLLELVAKAGSGVAVYPIQDLLALGSAFRPADPKDERINVPGTTNEWNWGWRLPAILETLALDSELESAARALAAAKT